MEVYYTSSMTLNAVCAIAIMLTGIQKKEKHFLALALLNFLMFFFHYFTWQLHISTTLETATQMSRSQTMLALIAFPLLPMIFGGWCQYKYTKQLTLVLTVIVLPLLVLNFTGESSLRYLGSTQLIQVQAPFNEQISLIQGATNPLFVAVHCLFVANSLLLAFFSYRFFRQRESFLSVTIVFLLIGQVFANLVGYKIDRLEWELFYIGGLPLTILSVVCLLLISTMYKATYEKLIIRKSQKDDIDKAINMLAQEISNTDNLNFYNSAVINIQQLFNTKFVFVGVYSDDGGNRKINTISVVNNNKLEKNFSYHLKGTPCDDVVGKSMCTFENDVDLRFPDDKLLSDMGVKAYVGLPLFNKKQEPLGIVSLLHDEKYEVDKNLKPLLEVFSARIGAEISRDNLAKKLQQLAYFDYTTKLPNRASLFEKINSTLKKNITSQSNSLLMLVDLDNFKEVNKIYGYDVSDDILKEIGHRLKIYAGDSIFVARNDGDEFAILIEQLKGDKTSLIEVNWQAISAIIKAPIKINDQEIIVECSAGNVIYPLQTNDSYSVIRYAESALQQAKHNGRNQYAIFDENVQALFERQQIILKALNEAISEGSQLYMAYQPQTDNDGNLLGAESLIRWIHPEYGSISPAEFIPIIEQTELMHELGYWIIQEVFKQIKVWQIEGKNIPAHISINIAAKQLVHPDFVVKLVSWCDEYDISPSLIVLELTESGILHDTSVATETLETLRNKGFLIALDDFGTGYSSLSYLKDLPLDILKIDKSFIDDIFSPSTQQLIQSMFSISRHLNLSIIAEGMESQAQVDELVAFGCICFQGYFYSKPLKPDELINWHYKKIK